MEDLMTGLLRALIRYWAGRCCRRSVCSLSRPPPHGATAFALARFCWMSLTIMLAALPNLDNISPGLGAEPTGWFQDLKISEEIPHTSDQ